MTIEDPIKIFVGTQAEQMLALNVLEYSIRKNTSATVEVHPLFAAVRQAGINIPEPEDPAKRPRTPFSFQRFAIPELNQYQGKAIYLDSDMQVFKDIRELWDCPINDADLLTVYEPPESGRAPQFSVMVINCGQLKWKAEDLVRDLEAGRWTYQQFVLEMAPANKIASVLPTVWNELERYDLGKTALTHYTDMPTQPWLSTQNSLGWLWCQELFDAIRDGAISKSFVSDEVKRGWVRPSLIYQLEHGIVDPLHLPEAVIRKDKLEFTPPHALAQLGKAPKNHPQPTPSLQPNKKFARKSRMLVQNILRAVGVNSLVIKAKNRFL